MKRENLPLKIQIFYGLGVSYAIVDQIFVQWVMYYYMPPSASGLKPLIAPLYLSLAFVISRLVDAIADPLVGYWSDRTNTRWGRRIPFIGFGAIPLVLTTIAYFYPISSDGKLGPTVFLAVNGCLFFIFYTIVGAPYNALIPEISKTNDDRRNLSTWQAVFRLTYTAIAMVAPPLLISKLGGSDTEKGIRLMVMILGSITLLGLFITVFTIDEKKLSGGSKSEAGLLSSIKSVLSDKAFLMYLGGLLFFFFGFNIMRSTMNYYVQDIMKMGMKEITYCSSLMFFVSALFFYPINRISKRFGYRKPMLVSLVMLAVFSIALFYLGKVFPAEMGFVIFGLMGIPLSGAAFIFPPAMLSEISTVAANKTGVRIEGLFFGLQGFVLKMAFFLSSGSLPLILVSGSEGSFLKALTEKPEGVSTSGVYMTALVAAGAFLVSFIFYFLYPEEIADENFDPGSEATETEAA